MPPEIRLNAFVTDHTLINSSHGVTTVSSLPPEILVGIFSYLRFEELLPRVSRVCRAWHEAAFDAKSLTIRATPAVKRCGLPAIFSRFPLLESLILHPSRSHPSALVHDIARQFTGHPTLKSIHCASDRILLGGATTTKQCPQLEALTLPHLTVKEQDDCGDDDGDVFHFYTRVEDSQDTIFNGGKFRNLGFILKYATRLKRLEITDPSFVDGADGGRSDPGYRATALEELKIQRFTTWPMVYFFDWLGGKKYSVEGSGLPSLKTLDLDLEYLHLPAGAIQAIGKGCPLLETLKLRYAMLHPVHLYDVPTYLPQLRKLSLRRSEIYFEVGGVTGHGGAVPSSSSSSSSSSSLSYPAIVMFLTSRLRYLTSLRFSNCKLHPLVDAGTIPICPVPELPLVHIPVLKKLKILPPHDEVPSLPASFLSRYPHLSQLGYHVPTDAVDPMGSPMLPTSTPNLTKLELWYTKHNTTDNSGSASLSVGATSASSSPHFVVPPLSSLTLWSFPTFPQTLLNISSATLTHLSLNYLPNASSPSSPSSRLLHLPNLTDLQIRMLSSRAHDLCETVLMATTTGSPRLTSLTVEALHRETRDLDLTVAERIATMCPGIRDLKFSNFRFSKPILALFSTAWKETLTVCVITGSKAVPDIDRDLETYIHDLVCGHRRLRELKLTVSGLSIPGYEVVSIETAAAKWRELKATNSALASSSPVPGEEACAGMEPGESDGWQNDVEFLRLCRKLNTEMYKRYAAEMRRRYGWLEEVEVGGGCGLTEVRGF